MIDLRGLDPVVREYAEYAMRVMEHYTGVRPVVTSTFRSWSEQAELRSKYERCLREGRFPSRDCPYPANRPGDSSHNWGLSFDSWVPEGNWEWWNYVRQWYGFRVPDNDRVHAEVPDWRQYVT